MKKIFFGLLIIIILLSIFFTIEKPFYSVPILKYHSVNLLKYDLSIPRVTPEVFAWQMDYIHRRGYRVISIDEFINSLKAHKKLKNAVVITFDDGYVNNYTYAFPVLKKYGFPATIFVPTAKLGELPPLLNYKQMEEMEGFGITIGSHTINHAYLPRLTDERQLRREIFGSKEILEKNLGRRIDYFAYPSGGFNEHVKELVKEAGYTAAFVTNRGEDKLNRDIYVLKRIKITNNDVHWWSMWVKLSGYYLLSQKYKKPSE